MIGISPNQRLDCPKCLNGDHIRKVVSEDFYRCSGCKNEWFRDELIEIKYKVLRFRNKTTGKEVFVPLTPEKIAEWKREGKSFYGSANKFSTNNQPNTSNARRRLSKKDKNLLRRLKK